uniref:Methyltransferase n=1 Tax=viral metagenome TaxID=1070528 RepID=A0A6C0BMY3_9ZZZZ
MNRITQYFQQVNVDDSESLEWEVVSSTLCRYLEPFIGTSPIVCYIGVTSEVIINMFRFILGEDVKLVILDPNPQAVRHESDSVVIVTGNEGSQDSYNELMVSADNPDIIVDSGSHLNRHQIQNFETLFPWLNAGGVYVTTGTHSSYVKKYGGGLDEPQSFMALVFSLINRMHAIHVKRDPSPNKRGNINEDIFTSTLESVAVADSIFVAEKTKTCRKRAEVERARSTLHAERKRRIRRDQGQDRSMNKLSRRKSVTMTMTDDPITDNDTMTSGSGADEDVIDTTTVQVKRKSKNKIKNIFKRLSKGKNN